MIQYGCCKERKDGDEVNKHHDDYLIIYKDICFIYHINDESLNFYNNLTDKYIYSSEC